MFYSIQIVLLKILMLEIRIDSFSVGALRSGQIVTISTVVGHNITHTSQQSTGLLY
jgi:hypothetical protein